MHLKLLKPKQTLNKAYLKEKISRTDIEVFKTQFSGLLDKINDKADEEHLKSLIADFLKFTWYKDSHQINPIGKNDLVIHTGKSPADPVGVILEVKSPTNKGEMLTEDKPNAKALHELILYYLRERIDNNNNQIKYLVATNIFDWYIVDANEFDKKIYRNVAIKKLYETKKTDSKDNPWFYDELKKLLENSDLTIEATCFDIRDYKKIINNIDRADDKGLISLYKILSPVHLLKLPFANDSNTLQPKFYSELLHLIGLYEYKDGSKKLISRKKDGERNSGSLLENTIIQLDSHDKISRLDRPSQYGDTYSERIYHVALELVITWVNRILFLKLLEAQLINYHKGDRSYTFLEKEKIKDFDDLDKLFFRVLAKRANERTEDIKKLFGKVPYLNSSLFEPTELEHQTLFINGLEDFVKLPVLSSTVLKGDSGKTLTGNLDTLDYLFGFLNAYDFSSEGSEEIQEDNKQLINASVLGLIFEKINGYKDGSFFTPGFITMYMCRETIRRAVVQKFNEAKQWNCKNYSDLFDKIHDKKEANAIINSLKICDPAVGSGHFLVSALNEIITIKSDLRVLLDKSGRSMHHYGVEVVNDELIITDDNGDIFEYNPKNQESQKIQEALFHEKQTIIEGCLFGVDINPNSVKICRLRLWIELLKNAYYKQDTTELETLPNIDINIKVGNSLISRFALNADLKRALKKSKYTIDAYKIAVQTYREATNKDEKREMERLIATIKNDFRTEISANDPKVKLFDKKSNELYNKYKTDKLFEEKLTKAQIKNRNELEEDVNKLAAEIADIKTNKIFENAFEWRFEFPDVLNDEGDFVGFDAIIGNPPYMVIFDEKIKHQYEKSYDEFKRNNDLYVAFIKMGFSILKIDSMFSFITPNTFIKGNYFQGIRNYIASNTQILEIVDFGNTIIFDGVNVFCAITIAVKTMPCFSWALKSDMNNIKGLIEPFKSDFIVKNNLISKLDALSKFETYFYIKDVGFNYWSEGRGKVRGGSIGSKVFYNGIKENEGDIPFIKGIDIMKYGIGFSNNYLKHNWKTYLEKGDTFRFSQELFERPIKIVYRQTSNKIVAAIDTLQNFNDKTVHIIVNREGYNFNLKYVLALLNSKMFNYFFQSFKEEEGRAFAQVKTVDMKNLPFKPITTNEEKPFVDIVDQILKAKSQQLDISPYEKELNFLIYSLYDLTEEEIRTVEEQ